MDFITGLPVSTNKKSKIYNSMLVIVDRLIKIVYYNFAKVTINAAGLAKVIINVIVQYHSLSNSIIHNKGSVFISKF